MTELIVGSNQNNIGPILYNMERKDILKPLLNFKENWKKSILNQLIHSIFNLKDTWKFVNGTITNLTKDHMIQISYGDKNNYLVCLDGDLKVYKPTSALVKLFHLVYKDDLKDGFQQVYIKKELNIRSELHRIIEIYGERYVKALIGTEDLTFLISGQGTGKTQQIVKCLIDAIKQGKRVLIISNRISLGTTILRNMLNTMKDMEIDMKVEDNKLYFYKKSHKNDMSKGKNLIISPESIKNMMDDEMRLAKYDIIWIDECKKVMNDYGNSQTLNNIRQQSLDILQHYIRTCSKVYISDADMNEDVIAWIEKLRAPVRSMSRIIWNQLKTDQTETYLYESLDNMNARLFQLIEANKSIYLSSTSVNQAEDFYKDLRKKYPTLKILKITGEAAESTTDPSITKLTALMNCNQEWKKYDMVITTPCIVYGTSFDEEHFDEVFNYYKSTLTGELACQALHRVRKLKNNRINMHVPFFYKPYLITEEEDYLRIMNGDIALLKKLDVNEAVRENILSNIGCRWDNKGNRIINTDSLLYWMMIRTKIDENRSLKNIKQSIIEELCKNRTNPVYVEIIQEEEEKNDDLEEMNNTKNDSNEENKDQVGDNKISRIVGRPNLCFSEYSKLKLKQDRTFEEEETLRKNMLRFMYNYDDLDEESYPIVDEVDRKWQGILRYLKGSESVIKDITDLDGPKMLRSRYEELLGLVGFTGGVLSKDVIESSKIKVDTKIFMEKLGDLQKKMKAPNQYRGSDKKIHNLMLQIRSIGIKLGLCEINIVTKIAKGTRKYTYSIEQDSDVKEVLRHMLIDSDNKLNNKFNKDLISKIGWDEMESEVKWYLGGCMMSDDKC